MPSIGVPGGGRRLVLLAVAAAALLVRPLVAQNLFVNPELAEADLVSGWQLLFGGPIDWTGVDADGCPTSGSVQLPSGETDIGSQWAWAAQCMAVDAATWPTGAHLAFTYNSNDAQLVYAILSYYQGSDCGVFGGAFVANHAHEGATGPGWHRVVFDDLAIPPAAGSVWAGLAAEAGGLVPIEILFDRAWFGRASPIFTDDFEPGTSCRWTVP